MLYTIITIFGTEILPQGNCTAATMHAAPVWMHYLLSHTAPHLHELSHADCTYLSLELPQDASPHN
jgi:hypothetical protein